MPVAPKSSWFKAHWRYLLGAIALHAVVAGLFGLTMLQMQRNAPPPTLAIEAVVVDAEQLAKLAPAPKVDRERERREAEERRRQEQEAALREQQRRDQAQREQAEREEAERQAQQREQERMRLERERAEQERLARERAEAERRELERKRQEAERQAKLEAERKRIAEIQRKQREREEAERKRREAENAARERALREQLAAEEALMQARSSGAMSQYAAMIQQHVERQWNRPPSARPGIECEVMVTQSPNGTVLRVQVGQCNGDQAVRQSIENAVQRASPLPLPPDSRLFERNLRFIFKPAD